jgi:hypothetical protein
VGCGENDNGLGFLLVWDTEDMSRNSITPELGRIDFGMFLSKLLLGGADIYLGADDNLDAGEHDGASGHNGTNQVQDGPSDGGAIVAHTSPDHVTDTPTLANPLAAAGAAFGACADGICFEAATFRQSLYEGTKHGDSSRNVADYDGKAWDPYTCSSGSPADENECHDADHKNMNDYKAGERHDVHTDPGVQVYEDPDPQASPIDPLYEAGLSPTPVLYPLIGIYIGTCGVIVGGAPLVPAGTLPMANSAGQLVVPTGC